MNWTKETPTREGYYWFRWPSYDTPEQYEVAEVRDFGRAPPAL